MALLASSDVGVRQHPLLKELCNNVEAVLGIPLLFFAPRSTRRLYTVKLAAEQLISCLTNSALAT